MKFTTAALAAALMATSQATAPKPGTITKGS